MGVKRKIQIASNYVKVYRETKIFGIGANKTGTTSLRKAMKNMGYIVGSQSKAEKLLDHWAVRDFDKIIKYCYSAHFFQDIPFSLPYTFLALDQSFPNSKFILTVRDNSEQWYQSLIASHAKLWGNEGKIPSKKDLKKADYNYTGGVFDSFQLIFETPESDLYNKEKLIQWYERHNNQVLEYFRHRPEDLLVLNVAQEDSFKKLSEFLGEEIAVSEFPWENKT